MKKIFFWAFCLPIFASAQLPGDDLFAINQVIRVDITFNQTGFWDSLVANYPLEKDMMAAGFQITDQNGPHQMDSIAIRLKGNSSYGHPGNKKSFKVDINQWVTGQDYDGMKKMNFNNGFKDPTFMREKVYFDLCQSLGILAPRVNYANVYMNGTFWGFYAVVEQVDKQFLDWATVDNLGNLYKAGDNSNGSTPADLMYYGATASTYYTRYELKTNEDLNDWSDLLALISFINNSSETDFGNNFGTNMNQSGYIKSMALDNMFSSLDSYLNSARNYYLYHNLTTSKWEWIKWDGNEAFGMYSGGQGTGNLTQLAPNYSANSRPLLSKMLANTTLYQEYLDYMCYVLENYFNSTYMNPKIEEIKTLIEAHVAADNNKMYTTQNFIDNIENSITVSGGMGNQTIFGLKSFITDRNSYLTGVVTCSNGIDENKTTNISVYPNPFETSFLLPLDVTNIKIVDLSGKTISFDSKNGANNSQEIELKAKAGYYIMSFTYKNRQESIKLLKQD